MTALRSGAGSVLDLLDEGVRRFPNRVGYTFTEGESSNDDVTFADVRAGALTVAAAIAGEARELSRIVLGYPSGRRYLEATFGCLYAGVTPVSGHVPEFGRAGTAVDGLVRTARATGSQAVLVGPRLAHIGLSAAPDLTWIVVDDGEPSPLEPSGQEPEFAYVQATSGSTAAQRGVALTGQNLIANLEVQCELYPVTDSPVCVSWLPMSHDMGFVGPLLQPLYAETRSVFLTPLRFVMEPACWLRTIARFGARISGCPNFGYDHVLRRVSAADLPTLDLSSWSCAISGGEPIKPDTLDRFAHAFAYAGFDPTAFTAGYGLAEATSVVTAVEPNSSARARTFEREDLQAGCAVPSRDRDGRRLIGHGWVAAGHEVVIVDPQVREPLPPGRIGEIWVSGPAVAERYIEGSDEENAVFAAILANGEGPYLRTGDDGFHFDGELFVTGRRKELILVRGINHAPQDIEATVRESSDLLDDCRVAVSDLSTETEEDAVLVAVEVDDPIDEESFDALVDRIQEAVIEQHGIRVSDIAVLPTGGIPVTTSGKIRRRELARRYVTGEAQSTAIGIRQYAADPA